MGGSDYGTVRCATFMGRAILCAPAWRPAPSAPSCCPRAPPPPSQPRACGGGLCRRWVQSERGDKRAYLCRVCGLPKKGHVCFDARALQQPRSNTRPMRVSDDVRVPWALISQCW